MDGRAVFDFANRDVARSIKEGRENGSITHRNWIISWHNQANIRILDKMAKKIGVDRDKLPCQYDGVWDTSAASIPILLSECGKWHDSFRW